MKQLLGLIFAFVCLLDITSFAATSTWVGSVSTNWNTAANWSPALIPGSGNDIVINGGAFAPSIPTAGVTINNLSFSASGILNFASNAVLTVKGTASVNNSGTINLGAGQMMCTGSFRVYALGTFNAGSGFVTVLGTTFQLDSGSAFNCGTSTFYFNGITKQTLRGGAGSVTFYDVLFGSGGKDTSRLNVRVLHNAVIESGSNLSIGQKDFTVEGDFVNNGTQPAGNPYIVDTITPSLSIIELTFDEAVSTNTANVAANYSITNGGYTITAAARTSTNTAVVRLTVSPALTDGVEYTLQINNVEDGNGNAIVPGTLKLFTAVSSAAVPTLTSISPTAVGVGSSVFTMTVTGANFVPSSVVKFNGSARETIYVSSTQLRVVITDSDLGTVGTYPITVYTPPPGGGTSSSATFTVATVNHAPTFVGGADQSVLKNSGLQTVVGWASSITSGSGDGNQAPYTFVVTNDNNALFSGQPAITVVGTSGTLTYTPATDATGVALVTVYLRDSAGTAGGGTDTSAPQTFYISVGQAAVTAATGGSSISADTVASGTFTALTGPTYAEGSSGNASVGTIILNAPTGFEFDTGGTAPTVLITRTSGDALSSNTNNINSVASLTSAAITSRTASQITFTITNASRNGVTCSLKWQNVRVRPTAGTPLATGDIKVTGTSVLEGVSSFTSFGPLSEIVGSATQLIMDVQPSVIAIAGFELLQQPEVALADQFGNYRSSANGGADDSSNIKATVATGAGTLQGTSTISASDGIASFLDLYFSNASTNRLKFTSGSLIAATSTVVTVVFSNQPPTLASIANVTVNEDSGATSVSLSGISTGPASEGSQVATVTALSSNPSLVPNPTINYTNPATTGTLIFTPATNQSGTATITVTVRDDGGTANGGINTTNKTFTITVNSVNDAPTLSAISNLTINEDASAQTVSLSGISTGATNESQTLTVTATSNNTSLIPNPTVIYTSPNATGSLQFTPVADANGTATITVVVADNGGTANGGVAAVTNTFTVTVNAVNDAPTLAAISNLTVNEDAAAQNVSLSGITSGAANESQTLTVTATSSNTSLIPNPTVTYTSANTTGSLSFTPLADANGTATISVVVSDGQVSITNTFSVVVNAVEDAPTLSAISNRTINEDAGTQNVSIASITSGAANEGQTLTVTAFSSNTSLIPNPTVSYTSPATTGSLSFSPVANENGAATIRVVVNDGVLSVTNTFTVTVTAVNDVPTLAAISSVTINEDATAQNVSLSGIAAGPANESQALTVTASSSNTSLIPNPTVTYTSANTTGSLQFTPVANANGTATITVVVADNGGTANGGIDAVTNTFTVTVTAVNDAPTLAAISNLTINEDATAQNVSLSGITAGPANESQALTVTATSSNTSLIPNPTVSYTSANTTGSLQFSPVANANGTVTITVVVSDNGGTANSGVDAVTNTFTVTVTAVNDAPTLAAISNLTINEDATAQNVSLSGITSGGSESQTLTVTATSSNTSLIPNPTVTYTSPNTTGSLQFTPVANANGTATVTVIVTDNGGTANGGINAVTNTFTVTVTAVNDAPTLAAISNLTINEDATAQNVTLSGITSGAANESQMLTVTATSSNPSLILNPTVTYTSPNTTGSLQFTPVADANGTATITVIVADNGGTAEGGIDAVTNTFVLTVSSVNDLPTLTAISNRTIDEDAGLQTVNLSGITSGPSDESQTLTVTATSSNTGLIPDPTVSYTSPDSTGVLQFSPVANAHGTATISVTVSDGGLSVTKTFVVTVSGINDSPTLDGLNNITLNEDAAQQTLSLSGISSGAADEHDTLTVTAFSSNTALIPDPTVVYASPGTDGVLSFTPVADESGEAIINVVVSDGNSSITNGFVVTVNPMNDTPTLDEIGDIQLVSGQTANVAITGITTGAENESQTLTVTASSSDPNAATVALNYLSPNSTAQLTVTAISAVYERVTVTVTVSDGSASFSRQFLVAVGVYKADFTALVQNSYSGPIAGWLGNLRNKNTWRDLVVANHLAGTLTVRLCNDLGGFLAPKTITVGGQPSGVHTADVNRDLYEDIVASDYSTNSVVVVTNLKNGVFATPVRFRIGKTSNPGAVAVRFADFNKDGRPDIVSANQLENTVSVLLCTNSTFGSLRNYQLDGSPNCVGTGDITGDTNIDIYVGYGNSIQILPGDGKGNFDTNDIRTVTLFDGGDPQIMHVLAGNLNGDTLKDFVTANANSNSVSVLLAQEDGSYVLQDYPVGARPQSLLLRDVNHDGKVDITVANTDSDTLSILIGVGDGTFARQLDVAAGDSPVVVLGSNFNNDSATDLAVLDYNPNTVRILIFGGPLAYAVTTNVVEDVATTVTLNGKIYGRGTLQYKIVRAPAHGTLNVSGAFTNPKVVYTPATNYFGKDTFSYMTTTGDMDSTAAEVKLSVLPVNDAPRFIKGGDIILSDTTRGYTNVWATCISVGATNELSQKATFTVTTTNGFYAVKPTIATNGVLRLRIAPKIYGTNLVTVQLKDTGGTANGGKNASAIYTFKVIVPNE